MSEYLDRYYMIFDVSEVNNVDFTQVIETSIDTIRISLDGIKTFVKWDGLEIPSSISALTTKDGPYNYDEMNQILSTIEWNRALPPP